MLDIPECKPADSMIILAAFQRWGEECFAQLIGDWALSLWSQLTKRFILRAIMRARGHSITSNKQRDAQWSTYLETFSRGKRMPIQ